MFFISIIFCCLLAAVCGYSLHLYQTSERSFKKIKDGSGSNSSFKGCFPAWLITAVALLVPMIISVTVMNDSLYTEIQNLKVINKKVEILEGRKIVLTHQYSALLDSSYSGYEGWMYKELAGAVKNNSNRKDASVNVSVLPTWPQSKYMESLTLLVDKIEKLNDVIYDLQLSRQDKLVKCRSLKSGIWVPNFLLKDDIILNDE